MRLTERNHLLSQKNVVNSERIVARRMRRAVVDSVNSGEGIFVRKRFVEARGSEIFPHVLHGIGESFGDSAWRSRGGQKFGAIGYGPQSEQRANAGQLQLAREAASGTSVTSLKPRFWRKPS